MTTPKAIMFLAFLFIVGLLLSLMMGGLWFDSGDQALMKTLTAFKIYNFMGMFKIPWINIDFFTVGLPKLLTFDFAFFGSTYGLVQYGFYIVTIGIIWGLIVIFLGMIANFWSRLR